MNDGMGNSVLFTMATGMVVLTLCFVDMPNSASAGGNRGEMDGMHGK